MRGARGARGEHPFAFSLSPAEPLVTGVLDLIVEQPDGGSLIVDYKSDRLVGGEDLERLVRRDYGFQRLLYALAAIEGGAPEVEVAHWFLERPRMGDSTICGRRTAPSARTAADPRRSGKRQGVRGNRRPPPCDLPHMPRARGIVLLGGNPNDE